MKLTAFLSRLLKEDTPDEEERIGTPPQRTPSPHSETAENSEKTCNDEEDEGVADEDSERDVDQQLQVVDVDDSPEAIQRGPRRILSRILALLFPSPIDEGEIQAYIPHYRILPILSGITIPFSILLEIPGLTGDWYRPSSTGPSKHNPPLLSIGIALSIFCAVAANACLIVRFLERRVRTMTILCIAFLSIHDITNVVAICVVAATKGNYSFGQAFWMTLCSTIVSMFTNLTLIVDLVRTHDFKRSGSGLTRRQRSLVIIIIGLFCYLALGALINALLLDLSFINGLYFTVVTIETIGFGDIVPKSRSSRVFICFYATFGVINIAFVVGYLRETVLEGLDFGYRKRLLAIQERRRAARRRRRAEKRWRHAIIWRLRQRNAPVWIPENPDGRRSVWCKLKSYFWRIQWRILSTARKTTHHNQGRRHGMKLNLWALPRCHLEAASLEAGVPLDTFLPEDFYETYDQEGCHHNGEESHPLPSWFAVHPVYRRGDPAVEAPTQRRLGAMAAMLTKLSFFVYESGGNPLPNGCGLPGATTDDEAAQDSSGSLQTTSDDGDYRADVASTEQKAYYTRSSASWIWFLIFWMGGAAIFKVTEGWTYGLSIYFCFIAFSTIGYGDLAPTTPAGRSIFVVWALVGVATMTIFISIVSEAYSARYKGILGRNSFKYVVQKYRKRTRVELSEQVQRVGTSAGVKVHPDTLECDETDVIEHASAPVHVDDDGGGGGGAVASTSKSDPNIHARRSLERLPRQILTETRSIQQYLQMIGELDTHSADTVRFVDQTVWGLVDEVTGGRKLPECTKVDILRDSESRQTLVILGIERSLRELVNMSEQAIAAIQERDRIIAKLGRENDAVSESSER